MNASTAPGPQSETPLPHSIAAFEHLTGPSRGTVTWIHEDAVYVALLGKRVELLADIGQAVPQNSIGRLRRAGTSFEIEAAPDHSIWLNGTKTQKDHLSHGDVVEFGEKGPISRFRLYNTNASMDWTIDQIIGDCYAYIRNSRKPLLQRLAYAAKVVFWRLVRETSIVFRVMVLAALTILAAISYYQWQVSKTLQDTLALSTAQIEGIATTLDRARKEALRPSDLNALREELSLRLSSNVDRLKKLEQRSGATARVVERVTASVAFIQGSYGFVETSTGRKLRQVVSSDGIPLRTPRGQPFLSLEGNGPIAEIHFTGTGFLIEGGDLITNRHVALPWETNASPSGFVTRGLEPQLVKLIAYLPGQSASVDLELQSASDRADLAVLKIKSDHPAIEGLKLATEPPKAGEEIILMGYPTGLKSLLAQSGVQFIEELRSSGETDFWNVASRLAAKGFISPLASGGIVGKVNPEAIVYDAETTHGGSGGPVVNTRGEVIAVNTAILPEFGGSNLGVPATVVREFLTQSAVN